MIVCRLVALLFACGALIALGGDVWQAAASGEWQPQALGQVWFQLDAGSLNLLQAVVQRYLHPWLWDPVIVQVLLWPAWVVPGALAALLFLICRRRHRIAGTFD
ncbi:MAG: hypothetical protein F4Y03_08520 [Alphaproteobacteria bacterium]|nr:hypothetical protein [Alphaproteobacteria bacterium]